MAISNIYTILNSMAGFSGKVVFDEFPESQNQTLPYINLQAPTTETFGADNVVYYQYPNVDIELYTKRKDRTMEARIEETLTENGYFYTKQEGRIDSQSCYQVIYTIGA